ncbi:MAG: hypothetical protein BGP16_08160 [Sphingobium sp. 66-54]|nr:MAG: hypothetical protein BGP16_08160 [Sphingobium sp. 66-54]
MAEIIARTERLLLRTEAEGDQRIWRQHMNVPAVMAHLGGPRTDAQIADTFARMAENRARDGFSFMMLERRSDGLLIGHCGLARIEPDEAPAALHGQMQIGWMLRADCWGQGYALEAARCVAALAFERYGAATLFGQTSLGNAPSWRLMERLGMIRRADLAYVDPAYPPEENPTIVYDLTAARWRAGIPTKKEPQP